MSFFELKIKFPVISEYVTGWDIREERERLKRAGWLLRENWSGDEGSEISREIDKAYLVEVHWSQRFLDLKPAEISVVFGNALLPKPIWASPVTERFLDTFGKWERVESDVFLGFWYEIRADSGQKTIEVRVSGGQQLGKENLKRFLLTLGSYYVATKIMRQLHQFRMAAEKKNVLEMDRHYNEILETLGRYLPR